MSAEPFSRSVRVTDIPAAGRVFDLEADTGERLALAELLGILAIDSLTAAIEIRPVAGGALTVRGGLKAAVVQTDVVTLDPVAQSVSEPIDVTLAPAERPPSRRRGQEPTAVDEEDGPEIFHGNRFDLGTLVREHLALGLDPYPRAADVAFPGHVEDDPAATPSPLAGLSAWRRTDE